MQRHPFVMIKTKKKDQDVKKWEKTGQPVKRQPG